MPLPEAWFVVPELVFTVLAVAACAAIYWKTKQSYDLTRHRGIKYFRDAFVLFGLAYVTRFLFSLLFLSRLVLDVIVARRVAFMLSLLPLAYFSTAAALYLVLSLVWRKLPERGTVFGLHAIALALSVAAFLTRSQELLIALQAVLMIVIAAFVLMRRPRRKGSPTRILYLLVIALWLVNLGGITRRHELPWWVNIAFHAAALITLLIIYLRVRKWA